MSFISQILARYDALANGIPNLFGIRPFKVYLKVTSWSGQTAGQGARVDTIYPILVNSEVDGYNNPYCKQLSQKDVVASGGLFSDMMLQVGPLVPSYTDPITGQTGGTLPGTIEQAIKTSPQEIHVNVQWAGASSASGDWFEIVSSNFESVYSYYFTVKKEGTQNP
jgi:hypothetical protein